MQRFRRVPAQATDLSRFTASPGVVCAVCGEPAPRRVRRQVAKKFPRIWRLVTPWAHFPFCEWHGQIAAWNAEAGIDPMDQHVPDAS